jgi:hypothetical protein
MACLAALRSPIAGPPLQLALSGLAYLAYLPVPVVSSVRIFQRQSKASRLQRAKRSLETGAAGPSGVNIFATGAVPAVQASLATATVAQGLLMHCHPAVELGRSPIHGRGLVAAARIPAGTRVVTAPVVHFIDAVGFAKLMTDAYKKLPDAAVYSPWGGVLSEVVLRGMAHHLVNHSCSPNMRGGLSRALWAQHAAAYPLHDVADSDDPNSLFTTRDVDVGEELTVDYSLRSAGLRGAAYGLSPMCRCGSSNCRGYLRTPPKPAAQLLKNLAAGGSASVKDVLAAGYDDELAIIGLQTDPKLLQWYLRGGTDAAVTSQVLRKGRVIETYRHVFKSLNAAAPTTLKEEPLGMS